MKGPLHFITALDPAHYENDAMKVVQGILLETQAKLKEHLIAPDLPSEHRMWEYGMGLLSTLSVNTLRRVLEVGGSNSLFLPTLASFNKRTRKGTVLYDALETKEWATPENVSWQKRQMEVIDPEVRFLQWDLPSQPDAEFDFVACISVIEHEVEEENLIRSLAHFVAPGGVLYLTSDFGEKAPDTYHFSWMRERIYTPASWKRLVEKFAFLSLFPVEGELPPDYEWKGAHVYGSYNFACMTLQRRALEPKILCSSKERKEK